MIVRYTMIVLSALWLSSGRAELANEDETLEMVYGSDRMVSIATGSEQLLYKAPAIANVITRQDIEHASARHLNELLEMVPGLHISEDYFAGDAIYTMRGFFRDPDAGMLFMINGVTVNTLEKGSRVAGFHMPLNNIEQIEIIRGPGSAVYGADAFVGVINIITRRHGPDQEYGVKYGSFSSKDAWLLNNFQLGQWQNHLSIQYQATEGDQDRIIQRDLQTFFDGLTATSASIASHAIPAEYNVFDMEFNASHGNWNINQWLWLNSDQSNGHGVPGLDVIDPDGSLDSRVSLTSMTYHDKQLAGDWSLKLHLSYLDYTTDRHQYLLPAGSIAPVGDDGNLFTSGIRSVGFPNGMQQIVDSHEQHTQLEASGFYDGWTDHSIRLSTGYQLQTYEADEARNFGPGVLDAGQTIAPANLVTITDATDESLPDGERRLRFVSIQDEWDFVPDWSLTAGIRYDSYSDFGDSTNPRLALVWQTRYDLSTKFLYGRAFRAPVYRELNLQNQLGFSGNTELKPETVDTLELALDYRPTDTLHSNLSLFAYRAKDLIYAVEDTTAANTFRYENSGEQEGHGIEVELNWRIDRSLSIAGNFAWQYSKLKQTDMEAPNAPGRQLYARLIWNPANYWTLAPEIHYLASRPRALDDSRDPVKDNTRIDLLLRYQNHYNRWDFTLRMRNLLDADLREPSIGNDSIPGGAALADDIPLEEFSITAELRYSIEK